MLLGLAASMGWANAQGTCLNAERVSSSAGFWVNQCSVGIHVKWRGDTVCKSTSFSKYPCTTFVPAYERKTATVGRAGLEKHECQSNNPFDIVITEEPYGVVRCVDDEGSGDDRQDDSGGGRQIGLECPCSYDIQGDFMIFEADSVSNNRSGGTSGTLKLKVLATATRYAGVSTSGYILAEATLGELRGGHYWEDLSYTRSLDAPPAGTYYVTMTLTE